MSSKGSSSKALLLASGGLDSTTLAYWLQRKQIEFAPLFIDYGQHCAGSELKALKECLPPNVVKELETLNVSHVYQESDSRLVKEADLWRDVVKDEDLFLPQRNLLILALGTAFAQSRGLSPVYAGFFETNKAPGEDCCDAFFDCMNSLLRQTNGAAIELPFRTFSKSAIAQIGAELRVPLGRTYSCLARAEMPCGACPNCVDRLKALNSLS